MQNEFDIINYVYKNAQMGTDTTKTLLDSLKNKDNKIKDVVLDIFNSYEDFTKQANKILSQMNEKGKKYSFLSTVSADMGVKMKVSMDNSDSAIADMLIKGLTKGEIEMTKMFDTFDKDIDSDIKKIIRDFKDFQTNAIIKLKKYL